MSFIVKGARGVSFWTEPIEHDPKAAAAHRHRGEKGNKPVLLVSKY